MPLLRKQKEAVVAAMTERFGHAQAIVLADYRGLNVVQMGALRRELRPFGAAMHVVKNSLARRALEAAGLDTMDEHLVGPTLFVLMGEDLAAPTKAVLKVAKDTDKLRVKGGLLGGRTMDARAVAALAELPPREELLAQFVGLLEAPQRQFLAVLEAPQRDLVGVLRARVEAA